MEKQIPNMNEERMETQHTSEQRSKKILHRPQRFLALRASLIFVALLFSFFLMFHTFSYNPKTHSMMIATKAWSDFGAHIPLIRSFSYGSNLTWLMHGQPVESPLYPNEPIRYHFGFYALVGMLEKLGLRIDWALNIPSALGFWLLLLSIGGLSYMLFQNYWVSVLSIIFFLFNGSLSFIRFFQIHPLNAHTITDIITNSRFPAFGPWDGNTVTAFWTLNIYTNQRHLAFSYGIILSILCLLLLPAKKLAHRPFLYATVIAALAGLLLFFNYPAAFILAVFCLMIFVLRAETRMVLLIAGLVALPAFGLLIRVAHIGSDIVWRPGYIASPLTISNIVQFWIDNLGLHLVLIPLGIILAPKSIRRIFVVPLLVLFILPNLFRFSTDMINNHKFFNFFLILGNMFSAYAIYRLFIIFNKQIRLMRLIGLISLIGIIFFSMFSGIIDFFPIINDTRGAVSDIAANPDAQFFLRETPPDAVIANSTWFYHPASIAGRALFSGYTYFTWSYGYNQAAREQILKDIYAAPNQTTICALLNQQHIAFVELNPKPESYLTPNGDLWNSLTPAYKNPDTHLKIYSTKKICE